MAEVIEASLMILICSVGEFDFYLGGMKGDGFSSSELSRLSLLESEILGDLKAACSSEDMPAVSRLFSSETIG